MVFSVVLPVDLTTCAPSPIPLLRSSAVSRVERRVASGELTRVRRGILAPAASWNALPPWKRYLARVHAVTMTHPGAVLSHESAAAVRGLPVLGDPVTVHILWTETATARLDGGIRVHTTSGEREIESVGGIFVTTACDTVVDLARCRHSAFALAVADAALRAERHHTVERPVVANESRPSSRGRRSARWALHRADSSSETVLESVSRAVVEWLGFDQPELQ